MAAKAIHVAIENLKGNLGDKNAVNQALKNVSFDSPRGSFKFDAYNSPIHDIYAFEVARVNGKLVNKPIAKFPQISQFYTWEPKQFMAMKPYRDLANDWVK